MGIYDQLGVRTIINAAGTLTRLSGTLMPPEVTAAMVEASKHFVPMDQLQARASQVIAEVTGAEAGYVTCGCAAALTLGTAACVARLDPAKMNRLPDTTGMKDEVIMHRSHRTGYDHAIRAVGVKLVEIGLPYRTLPYQLEEAINGCTAAVAFMAFAEERGLPLEVVVEIAHRKAVPVLVDAAAELPPPENLRAFIAKGADLVAFSGGKALRGPQSSGILCGRKDLIMSAALQNQDMDMDPRAWTPDRRLIDKGLILGPPEQGIGRALKAGKEDIVGLLTALKLYVSKDHQAEKRSWEAKVRHIVEGLRELPHVTMERIAPEATRRGIPFARIRLDEEGSGMTAYEVLRQMKEEQPSIHPSEGELARGAILINPFNLMEGDEERIVERMREILTS